MDDSRSGRLEASLRFFTADGELPGCGHGTIAALAFLAKSRRDTTREVTICTSRQTFTGRVASRGSRYEADFDAGPIHLREPHSTDLDDVLDALGISSNVSGAGPCIATLGRSRLLVPISTRAELAALAPDLDRLRDACDRLGLLGCYVYTEPTVSGRLAARMFGPSIGVPEDIANANSTACLAAYLARNGLSDLAVDMGDSLGMPSTITASARDSHAGRVVRVGGIAAISPNMR